MGIAKAFAALMAGGAGWIAYQRHKDAAAAVQEAPQVIPASYQIPGNTSGGGSGGNQTLGALLGLVGAFLGNSGGVGANSGGSSSYASAGGATGGATASSGNYGQQQSGGQSGGGMGISAILNLIGMAEAPGGYDTVYAGSKVRPPRPITQMTVGQVMDWQRQSINAGSVSSAAGRYQIIYKTMRSLVSRGVLSRGELFGRSAQDRAATALMRGRGLDGYQSGQLSLEDFANNLAREWAGLPVVSGSNAGRSYYDGYAGNSATVSADQVRAALRTV